MIQETSKCAIWGTEATRQHITDTKQSMFDSPRAGGEYIVKYTLGLHLKETDGETKARLTDWLFSQRRQGVKIPTITRELINQIQNSKTPQPIERADKLLEYLAECTSLPGERIDFLGLDMNQILAICGSRSSTQENVRSEIDFFLRYLNKREFILQDGTDFYRIIVSVEGYTHLETLKKSNTESSLAFVAMWFDPSMDPLWENGIEPAIRDAGYEAVRIDKKNFNNKIDDEIIAQIRRSRFLVADFSQGNDGPRGGVYFEAGFAQGLNIPVIFTCRKKDFDIVHFDTRQFNHIVWENPEELKRRLQQRISATIGDGPLYKAEHLS